MPEPRQRRYTDLTNLDQFTARRLAREIDGTATKTERDSWIVVKNGYPTKVYRDEDGELTVCWSTRYENR